MFAINCEKPPLEYFGWDTTLLRIVDLVLQYDTCTSHWQTSIQCLKDTFMVTKNYTLAYLVIVTSSAIDLFSSVYYAILISVVKSFPFVAVWPSDFLPTFSVSIQIRSSWGAQQ